MNEDRDWRHLKKKNMLVSDFANSARIELLIKEGEITYSGHASLTDEMKDLLSTKSTILVSKIETSR
jgi:hypothetical protein